MKEKKLRDHAICTYCSNRIGHTGLPLFWTLDITRHGIKFDAVRRQTGLAMLLGGSGSLAQAMGRDEDMTEPVLGPITITLCEQCAMDLQIFRLLPDEKPRQFQVGDTVRTTEDIESPIGGPESQIIAQGCVGVVQEIHLDGVFGNEGVLYLVAVESDEFGPAFRFEAAADELERVDD